MHIDIGPSENATKALHLAWTLASMRMWTMAKQSSPPCCYAQILQPGPEHADSRHTCVEEMKTHHRNILVLETSRHNNEDSRTLWNHCHFLNMMPVRLLLEYFKRDMYRETSPEGRHLLTGLVGLLCESLWKPTSSFWSCLSHGFIPITYHLRTNFVPSSYQLRIHFVPTWLRTNLTSYQFRTNFVSTSYQLRTSFVPTLVRSWYDIGTKLIRNWNEMMWRLRLP